MHDHCLNQYLIKMPINFMLFTQIGKRDKEKNITQTRTWASEKKVFGFDKRQQQVKKLVARKISWLVNYAIGNIFHYDFDKNEHAKWSSNVQMTNEPLLHISIDVRINNKWEQAEKLEGQGWSK